MPYEKIDVCPKNCMLFRKENANKTHCDKCGECRYVEVQTSDGQKKQLQVAKKILRYLPFIPCLQRLYMSQSQAKHMTWHKYGHRYHPDKYVHPSDGEAWKQFDSDFPDFAEDARNVRVAIATDGFNPFSTGAAPYSCWSVFIIPLNLPPVAQQATQVYYIPYPCKSVRDLADRWVVYKVQPPGRVCKEKMGGGSHRQGSASLARFQRNLEEKQKRPVSEIEAYAIGRMVDQEGTYINQHSADKIAAYSEAIKETHGEDFDWENAPIDGQAVYLTSQGKPHGRYLIGNGIINTRQVLSNVQASMEESSDDPRPRQRLRLDPANAISVEQLKRELQQEREARESELHQEREAREREMQLKREAREQELQLQREAWQLEREVWEQALRQEREARQKEHEARLQEHKEQVQERGYLNNVLSVSRWMLL